MKLFYGQMVMIYKTDIGEIDLGKLTRLYPAALIEAGGEQAEMSLEWMESNAEKVQLVSYVLVFDFTPIGSEERSKKVLSFASKEELLEEMQKVAEFVDAYRK